MPAVTESSIKIPALKKLGIIAGGGNLPANLLAACDRHGITPFIIAFQGQTDESILHGRGHIVTRIGAAGKIIDTLKEQGISDLVLIGSIRRPSLSEMKPDLRAARFFARIGLRALGDDGLLTALRDELQDEGFTLHGIQDFMDDLLIPPGVLTKAAPDKAQMEDIARGVSAAHAIGLLDIGQSVVVQEGIVLGVEAIEGTNELISRCASYAREGGGPILVKCKKPGQDTKLDLPTIGLETVQRAADCGYAGIAIEAGGTLLVDRSAAITLANDRRMFIIAVDPGAL